MDVYTQNVTKGLVQAILAITDEQRYPIRFESICQYVYCIFSINDHDDHNTTCHVKSLDENHKEIDLLSTLTRFIHLYIYPLFILMGIFGNSLSCFIMFINVRRHGYPTSLYLTLLAFVDCLFLIGSALPDWISQIHYRLNIKDLSNFSCRFAYWFGHFTTHLSAGLVVGVTVERFIAVQYPLIAHKLNTIRHTRIALMILIIFFFLVDSPVLILVKHLNENIHIVLTCNNDTNVTYERRDIFRCVPTSEHYKKVWVCVDFAFYTLIPFLIIVTLNSLIIRRLLDAQRFRQRMFRFSNNHTTITTTTTATAAMRHEQQEINYRQYSESHQAIEMLEKHHRYSRRFQSVPETQPLAVLLRPNLSLGEERRRCYSAKQSSISTEFSTLSFELKTRSQHLCENSSIRHKSSSSSSSTSNSTNTRLTILLLFISCSFLVLTLPAVVYNLIMSARSSTYNDNQFNLIITDNKNYSHTIFSYTLARLLMIINHSINFILYFVLGKRFRRDLKQLFIGYWRHMYR